MASLYLGKWIRAGTISPCDTIVFNVTAAREQKCKVKQHNSAHSHKAAAVQCYGYGAIVGIAVITIVLPVLRSKKVSPPFETQQFQNQHLGLLSSSVGVGSDLWFPASVENSLFFLKDNYIKSCCWRTCSMALGCLIPYFTDRNNVPLSHTDNVIDWKTPLRGFACHVGRVFVLSSFEKTTSLYCLVQCGDFRTSHAPVVSCVHLTTSHTPLSYRKPQALLLSTAISQGD